MIISPLIAGVTGAAMLVGLVIGFFAGKAATNSKVAALDKRVADIEKRLTPAPSFWERIILSIVERILNRLFGAQK